MGIEKPGIDAGGDVFLITSVETQIYYFEAESKRQRMEICDFYCDEKIQNSTKSWKSHAVFWYSKGPILCDSFET